MTKVKVFRFTTFQFTSTLETSINEWAAENNAEIINIEIGGAFTQGGILVIVTYK